MSPSQGECRGFDSLSPLMKLISLNTALFISNNKHVRALLEKEGADFVCLQEVARGLENGVDPKFVSKEVIDSSTPHLTSFFFGPLVVMNGMQQKNFHGKELFDFQFGGFVEYGNYTRSRFKIMHGENVFVQSNFAYRTDFSMWPDEDHRAVLITDHDVHGKKLRILNYHGIWTRNKQGNSKTLEANKKIVELAKNAPGEVIICGDFNLFPDTPSMKQLSEKFESLVDTYHIKTTRPASNELSSEKRNVVDYVWVSSGIKVKNFAVLDSDISDHLPLICEFEL